MSGDRSRAAPGRWVSSGTGAGSSASPDGSGAEGVAPSGADVELDPQIWEAVFEASPAPMAVYDRATLHFVAVNAAGRLLYGYDFDACTNFGVLDLYPPEDVADRRRVLTEATDADLVAPELVRHRLADGRLAEMQVTARPVSWCGRPARIVTVTDVTQLRRVERELATEAARLHRVVALQSDLAEAGPDVDRSLSLVADGVAELVEAANSSVWWADGDRMVVRATAGSPATYAVGDSVPIAGSLAGSCFCSEELVHVRDTATHSDYTRALASRTGIGSLVLVPLTHQGAVLGALGVSARSAHAFGDSALEALRLVAGLVAGAVQRAEAAAQNQATVAALQASEKRFSTAFDNSPIGMIFSDAATGVLLGVNPAMCELVGRGSEELLGRRLSELAPPEDVDASGDRLVALGATPRPVQQTDRRLIHASGRRIPVLFSTTAMGDPGHELLFTQVVDVSEQHATTERLAHAAAHDPLTSLPNRINFAARIECAISMARRENRPIGLVYVDLDGFKAINDNFGHASGDQVLIEVSRRLRGVVRSSDSVARLGGDEFAVLLADPASPEAAAAMARRILEALRSPVVVDGREFGISASLGVTFSPSDSRTIAELLRDADDAMYRAKAAGGGRYEIFEQVA